MYVVLVTFDVKPEAWEAFLPLMAENARASLHAEPGCLQFDVCRDPDAPRVVLYEVYTDRAAFDAHLATAHFKAFDAAVAPMIAAKQVALLTRLVP